MVSAALLPGSAQTYQGHPEGYARTVSESRDINPDGSYHYSYAIDNGITAEQSGLGGVQTNGRASWTSPEGIPVEFSYTADENGYQATGSHVPATPEHVIRALEYIRSHPQYEDNYSRRLTANTPYTQPAINAKPVGRPTFRQGF